MSQESTFQSGSAPDRGHGPALVVVTLNGAPHRIRGGKYQGAALKRVLSVPAEHELDLVICGEFRPIGDDERIEIHGGETFVSHCGQGASS